MVQAVQVRGFKFQGPNATGNLRGSIEKCNPGLGHVRVDRLMNWGSLNPYLINQCNRSFMDRTTNLPGRRGDTPEFLKKTATAAALVAPRIVQDPSLWPELGAFPGTRHRSQ